MLVVPLPRALAAEPVAITSGTLTWGVKESFRSYVTGPIAGGEVTASAPATLDGTVPVFTGGSGTWSTDGLSLATSGGVRFTGHHGELDLRIANPRLVVTGTSGSLNVDVVDSAGRTTDALAIGSVDLSGVVTVDGTTVTVSKAAVSLTAAGAAAFSYLGNPMYPAGTAMDPVSATFTVEQATSPSPDDSGTSSGSSTPTASSTPSPSAPTSSASPSPSVTSSASTTPTAKPDSGTSGWISWGVKASFRSYVTGPIAAGAVSVSGGAKAVSGGYRFGQSATSADPPHAVGTTSYRGLVRFSGHAGEMNLAMSSPRIQVTSANSAVLSVVVGGLGRVPLATLVLGDGSRSAGTDWVGYSGVPARLTAAGTKVFAYHGSPFYTAGTALDPVSFVIGGRAAAGSTATVTVAKATASVGPSATASASASATPSGAATPAGATCQVAAAKLVWGFKESFRAYVTGSIAAGEWTTTGNAAYQTPSFSWSAGSGALDRASAGQVAFAGGVRFTGHDGAMDTTVADPVVRLDGARGVLLLDVSGVTMDEALAGGDRRITSSGVEFVDLDLAAGTRSTADGTVTVRGIPATLTTAGHAAFPNYPAGTAFDPVTLSWTEDADCGTAATSPSPVAVADAASDSVPGWVWAGWAGSSAVGAVAGSAITLLVARRWLVKR